MLEQSLSGLRLLEAPAAHSNRKHQLPQHMLQISALKSLRSLRHVCTGGGLTSVESAQQEQLHLQRSMAFIWRLW